MTEEQIAALKNFIYWSCKNAVAEATNNFPSEYRRLEEAEKEFDNSMKTEWTPLNLNYFI